MDVLVYICMKSVGSRTLGLETMEKYTTLSNFYVLSALEKVEEAVY